VQPVNGITGYGREGGRAGTIGSQTPSTDRRSSCAGGTGWAAFATLAEKEDDSGSSVEFWIGKMAGGAGASRAEHEGKGLATLDRRDARTWTRTRSGLRWCSASRGKPGVRLSTTSNGSMKKTTGILEARKPKRNKKAQQAKNGRITPRNARLVLFLSRLLSVLRLFRVFSGISVRGGLIMGCFGPFEGLAMVLITSEVRLRGSAEKSKTGRSDSALNGRRSEGMRKAGRGGC